MTYTLEQAMRGRFITLEGLEATGKTTQANVIKAYLAAAGREVVHTREPGGTPLAERIRALLLAPDEGERVSEVAELLLMFAGRAQHIAHVIEPALSLGRWVLSDRFTDASYAYQGAGRGMDTQVIGALESMVQKGLQPDLTILLDAPVEVSQKRAAARGALDRFEAERAEFFSRARQGYLARAAADPSRFLVVDATQSIESVSECITMALSEWIAQDEQERRMRIQRHRSA